LKKIPLEKNESLLETLSGYRKEIPNLKTRINEENTVERFPPKQTEKKTDVYKMNNVKTK